MKGDNSLFRYQAPSATDTHKHCFSEWNPLRYTVVLFYMTVTNIRDTFPRTVYTFPEPVKKKLSILLSGFESSSPVLKWEQLCCLYPGISINKIVHVYTL